MKAHDRAFGVEIEFDSNGLGKAGVRSLLREVFDKNNILKWHFGQRIIYDGSELELKTPILRGKEGLKKLEIVMNALKDAGCITTEDDGLHVHHDAPEFTHSINNCIHLVKSWQANRNIIYQFVQNYRASDYWACPNWSECEIERMEKFGEIPSTRRHELNLSSLPEHGTIEFRLHEGTLDYSEAEAWILFGQKFIDRVLKHQMRNSDLPEKLLKKVRISSQAERLLLDKAKRKYV